MTTESLPDWPRQYFIQPGGNPFLFFVVYGDFGVLPELSASKYRSAGIPSGFELSHYDSSRHRNVLMRFQDGYVWDQLQSQNALLAAQIADAPECLILRGEIKDCATLNYLRDSFGLLTFLVDSGGAAVFDPITFHWWKPDEWRNRIFIPASAVPRHHVVILFSAEREPGLTWFHTRGLRKFGRSDLSIHNVPEDHRDAVIDLCNRFIELQAFGGVIADGQEIKMKTLPSGMTCHLRGDLDDPDFNNVHVEIIWPKPG